MIRSFFALFHSWHRTLSIIIIFWRCFVHRGRIALLHRQFLHRQGHTRCPRNCGPRRILERSRNGYGHHACQLQYVRGKVYPQGVFPHRLVEICGKSEFSIPAESLRASPSARETTERTFCTTVRVHPSDCVARESCDGMGEFKEKNGLSSRVARLHMNRLH